MWPESVIVGFVVYDAILLFHRRQYNLEYLVGFAWSNGWKTNATSKNMNKHFMNSGGKVGFLVHCRHKNVMDVKVITMMMIESQVNRAGQVKTNC